MEYVLVIIMFYTVLIIFSIITCSGCVSDGKFFGEFASFHGIGNVVIVKEEGSGVDTNLFKELNKMDIKTSVINYPLEKTLEASTHEIMYIILMTNLKISQLLSSLGQDVFSSSNVWLIRTCDFLSGSLYFPIDSQVFCFRELNDDVLVDEIYDIDPAMDQVVKEYGSWNESSTNRLHPNALHLFDVG